MHIDCAQFYGRIFTELVKNFFGPFDIDAEFGFFDARGCIGMCFGVNVGIDSKGDFRGFAFLLRDADDIFKLGFGFDVEIGNACIEGFDDFLVGFADAGVNDFCGVGPGLDSAVKLAAADDIEAGTGVCHKFEDVNVTAGLYRIADHCVDSFIGVLNLAKMFEECGLAVDIHRRTELFGYRLNGHVLCEEPALFVIKIVHTGA